MGDPGTPIPTTALDVTDGTPDVPPLTPAELDAVRALLRELAPFVPMLPLLRQFVENPPDLGLVGKLLGLDPRAMFGR